MKKAEIIAAFEGVNHNILWGNAKNKEITKLYLEGVPPKEIAEKFNLSTSRIGQIVARQARRALFYKNQKNDLEYQCLVEKYINMIKNGEKIIIQSEWENSSKHLLAVSVAREEIDGGNSKVKAYTIRIELEESDPLIWRRVVMPAGATFNRLHDIIQNVTNFQSGYPNKAYHLFEFDLTEENKIVTNDEDAYLEHQHYKKNKALYEDRLKSMPPELLQFEISHQERLKREVRKPTGLKIDDYIEKYKEIRYEYDFGDGWHFIVKLEQIVDDYYFGYPTLLDGAQTAPPDDVGGIHGFYEFMEIYRNPKHPDHEEVKEWAESGYFREYDPDWINESLKMINYKKTQWEQIKHDNHVVIEDRYRKK